MKKYVAILGILSIFSTSAHTETCAGGAGTVIYGNDADPVIGFEGTPYCKSNTVMNWWSAFAWCDAIGGELIDLTTECNKVSGSSGCPNLAGTGSGNAWTRNVVNDKVAYYIKFPSAEVYYNLSHPRSSTPASSMCVNFKY